MRNDVEFEEGVAKILQSSDHSEEERAALVRLMAIFAKLENPPDPLGMMTRYETRKSAFLEASRGDDSDALEEAFLNLYVIVHGHEAPYTANERERVDATGGYWCHAGGLSPILKAGPFIEPHTVFADYGAGNGLQGLLIQKLWPHRETIQIEISSKMVGAGKALQEWLEIPDNRVTWIVGDVAHTPPRGIDFIYMYRPLKPEGPGHRFYEGFAREVDGSSRDPIIIFSVADCLKEYLPKGFDIFYNDGHLTCFEKRVAKSKGLEREGAF